VGVDPLVAGAAFLVGLAFGSFLNVCILRLPHDRSLVRPPSSCPACGARIAWYDNIPLLSWLVLGGRCRRCRAPISVQYPLIELAVGLLWAGAALAWGFTVHALAGAVFGTILLGIAVTDARHYLIPDEFTWGGLALGLLLALGDGGGPGLVRALIGAAAGFALLYVVAAVGQWLFKEEAMGGGDVKMMAMVGAFLPSGWQGVLLTVFLGALAGTVVFVPLTLRKKRLVPFGVFLAMGAGATFAAGDAILEWYGQFLRGI
jgi:leader peptidase (prepilin peptidase)/N-methyltransferase